ncbi:MAG: glucose/sorbosone dehydrogenase [Chlorobi bacterium OLB4]|jgi:glucose/arabinose dehydrogenase|nr:MAG: glucose/sorbosone dehydrogenase [Chlorobi bacterium OLB4]MBW7854745.1 PQQ-dependent sugar dehydrogenase [Ignavibacteria bacterium]
MNFQKTLFLLVAFSFVIVTNSDAQYSWVSAFPNLPTFSRPIDMKLPPDSTNRIFIVQQRGIIWYFMNTPTVSVRDTFLNISDRVEQSGSETGLLGLAFHPDFANNGYFYVNYTTNSGGRLSRISRFNLEAGNPNKGDESSELILITVSQPYSNHNGGCVEFGPDGYLYIAFGDGGSGGDPGNRAQDVTTFLGKLLRIDVDTTHGALNYGIPPTNPFADTTASNVKKEIYTWGMRNTWKFSFDKELDSLWAADVGQTAREEIDVIRTPGNYGWRCYEGFLPYNTSGCGPSSNYIFPVFDYPRSEGISITGGYVYRGTKYPELQGKYIYGDYGSGKTWALTHENGNTSNALLEETNFSISSFGQDKAGELYLLQYSSSGRIYKLEGPSNVNPVNNETPSEYKLNQNFPNPFNPVTKINFSLPESSKISLKVFDLSGKLVQTLVDNQTLNAGNYFSSFNGDNLPSGIYICRFDTEKFSDSKRMVLLK